MAEKPSFSDILVQGRNILKQAGIEDWELDAWYLLGHITAMGRAEYFLRELEMVPENIVDEYYKLINIRASHVPLQHITGSQEFMGLNSWFHQMSLCQDRIQKPLWNIYSHM